MAWRELNDWYGGDEDPERVWWDKLVSMKFERNNYLKFIMDLKMVVSGVKNCNKREDLNSTSYIRLVLGKLNGRTKANVLRREREFLVGSVEKTRMELLIEVLKAEEKIEREMDKDKTPW